METKNVMLAAGLGAAAVWLYNSRKGAEENKPTGNVTFLPDLLDPTSDRNLVYQTGGVLADTAKSTLGLGKAAVQAAAQAVASTQVKQVTPAHTSGSYYPVIDGAVYGATYDESKGGWWYRIYNFQTDQFTEITRKLPMTWMNAPRILPGFPELKKAGKPWYVPWDGTGKGMTL